MYERQQCKATSIPKYCLEVIFSFRTPPMLYPIHLFHTLISPNQPLSRSLRLSLPKLLILHLPPIPRLWLIATRLLDASKRRLSSIQLAPLLLRRLPQLPHRDRLVPTEPLAHVDHPALALSESPLKLLALRGQGVDERRAETVGRGVPLDHYAVGLLETLCEGLAWGGLVWGG